MHRSGTSALARVVSLLGCALPATPLGANPTNPAGHWESDAVMRFNEDVLSAAGSWWSDWLPVQQGWYQAPGYGDFVARGAQVLRDEYGDAAMFVLKDPRMCRLAPLWFDILAAGGIAPAIVVPLRNPLEVADSLARRDGMDPSAAMLVWLRHVLDAEIASRGRPRVFTSYDDLLDNWSGVTRRIGAGLDLAWPRASMLAAVEIEGFLRRDLRHATHASKAVIDNPALAGWIREAYAVMRRWSEGADERAADHAALDLIRARFDEAGPAFARPLIAAERVRARVATVERERDELTRERDALAQERDGLALRLCEAENEAGGLREAQAVGQAKAAELAQHYAVVDRQWASLQQRIGDLERELAASARASEVQADAKVEAARTDAALEWAEQAAAGKIALAVAEEQVHGLRAAMAQAVAEAQAARDRLIAERTELHLQWMGAEAERAGLSAQLDDAQAALATARSRITEIASQSAQREEEARQAWAEAQALADQLADARSALAVAAGDLAESENWVSRLAADRRAAQDAQAQAERRLAAERNLRHGAEGRAERMRDEMARRDQRHEADKAQWRETLETVRARARHLDVQLEILARQPELDQAAAREAERQAQQAAKLAAEREEELTAQFAVELAAARDLASAREQALAQSRDEVTGLSARLDSLAGAADALRDQTDALRGQTDALRRQADAREAEMAGLANALQASRAAVGVAENEAARLARALAQAEELGRARGDMTQWLRAVEQVSAAPGRGWRRWMPQSWQRARVLRRLATQGLFDAAAYGARNPDVVDAGMDPLQHYIAHGIEEGRARG